MKSKQMMEHLLPFGIERILQMGLGVFWTITYFLIIIKGFHDHSLGVPFAALIANFSWEILFAFVFPFEPFQQAINFIWLGLDFIIVCQFFIYSKPQLYFNMKWFVFFFSLVLSSLLILGITVEFDDYIGKYSAFAINLMMSLLFIRMVLTQGILGQSLTIACTKMIGTLFASVLFYSLYPRSLLLLIMYLLIFVLDVVYIILVRKQTITVMRSTKSRTL